MILKLSISNFAVFENIDINFNKGLNVLTGETGSGKSIIIEALFMLLGSRATKDLIRKGKSSSLIEAVFDISDNYKAQNVLATHNIQLDDDDYLIISREILETGKSINRINQRIVPLNVLKDIGIYLIDIYGQFEQQYIFKKENHIILLDNIFYEKTNNILKKYSVLYKEYKELENKIRILEDKLVNKDLKIEQYKFEIDEIDSAKLSENEEETLIKELKRLSNTKEIQDSLSRVSLLLSNSDQSAINTINDIYSIIKKVVTYDDGVLKFTEKLDIIIDELHDLYYEVVDYNENLQLDEEKLSIIEQRISLINRLKRKYGFSLDKIFEYRNSVSSELDILLEAENNLNDLQTSFDEVIAKLNSKAEELSNIRRESASYLEESLVKELDDLNMKNIRFKVKFSKKPSFSIDGVDDIEFYISTNKGNDLNAMQKTVSGGEASRIMLALKKISSDNGIVSTMVFDEVDTGISGKTSQIAGLKMKHISKNHQIICVTHSPQIASMADYHYLIEKKAIDEQTYSFIRVLDKEARTYEIARLLSGINITDKSLDNAKELIDTSNNLN